MYYAVVTARGSVGSAKLYRLTTPRAVLCTVTSRNNLTLNRAHLLRHALRGMSFFTKNTALFLSYSEKVSKSLSNIVKTY